VSEPAAKPSRRVWWKYLLILAGAGALIILAGLWYITTDSFQGLVRRRLVAEVERITGGRAEIGSFHTTPFRMQVEVRDITVRGREAASEVPFVHTDRLVAQVKVISFLGTEFGFHDVVLEHPVIHVIFYPDGSTNVSGPRIPNTSGKTTIEQLFGLSIDRLDVRHGELLWDDQNIPLDFTVHDAALQMEYSYLQKRYEGRVLLGKADTTFRDFRPFAWMASAEFSLDKTFADIKSLKLNSGRSHFEANGRISDFRRPSVQGTYDAYLDLGEAASISRRRDLREGIAEFKGKGAWSLEQFATSGALALRNLGWQDNQIALNKANATADYYVSDKEIKLSKLQGKLLDGSLTGDAQIDNWLENTPVPTASNRGNKTGAQSGPRSTPQSENDQIANVTAARPQKALPNKKDLNKKERSKLAQVQTGTVHLRVREVSARALATALNTPAHRIGSLRPAGFATGTLDARWKGSPRDAEVAFMFDLNPPLRSAPGELPVAASIQGTYRGAREELQLSRLNASTPASRVQASGTLSSSSALRLSVLTTNLDDLRPIIAALHGPADLPFTVHGSASFNGVVSGTLSNPTFAGNLTAQDFDFALPATSRRPQQQVHWDSLSTGIQLSLRGLTLRGGNLRRGDTSAEFEVTATLQHGQFMADDPFTARINLHNVDVASTATLSGYDYPVTGKADLFLNVSGTRANPQAQGTVHATDASAYGQSISRFDADVRIAGGETAFNNIRLVHDDSAITGNAAYDPSTHVFKFDLVGTNFDLSRIPPTHLGRLTVEGRGGFTLRGSGTLDAPNVTASVHIDSLTLDHELVGALDLEAVTKGNELHVAGHSNFTRGVLSIDGTVQMRDDYPTNVQFKMDNLDLDALWRSYMRGELTGHSAVAGTLTMQGPLRNPQAWNVTGNFTGVSLDVEYAQLHNQDPVRFTYAQESLHIEQMHFVGEGTDLTARGTAHLSGARELDLAAEGHVDLKLLNSFDQDLAASGVMTMNMTVGGTISEPFPQGKLQLANGTVTYAGLPSGLSEMNGSLVFTRDRIHIEKLTARTGGGTLDLKGDATTYNRQLNFNLTAVGKEVRLRYPPGVSSVADAELHWVGTRSSSTVSGEIMVTKLAVTPNFDFSSYLERSRHIGAVTPANSPLYGVKLDIHVQTAPELQMKTAVARLSGDADLRIRGSVARPSLLGRADILEGEATFNGTKFRLERGDITFANPVSIEPLVNLQASTHVRNYDLNITVTGSPDRLAVNYRSEPPLPKSDIIALLALGRTSEESQQLQQQSGQSPFTDEASAMIINQAINSTVSSRMQKLFGVSRIKIDPQGLTTETNPTARGPQVTIEQQFANNVSLTYSTNVSQSSQQIIQGEYFFTRSISVVGTRDQNGVVSFDVRIRRQKK
jgi:translocation and assembly module TamB